MLIYEQYVPASYRAPFVAKVRQISSLLGINPNWLMAIMYWESARTFSPSITNSIGATGLIQFMESTAKELGTTTAALRQMSAVEQLDYVYKYILMWNKRLGISKPDSYVDLYLMIFFPSAVNKGPNYLIQSSKLPASLIAAQNPAFDKFPKDGKIYVHEIEKVMLSKLPSEWIKDFVKKKVD